ncbi:MAG: hypothetical protein ABIP29_02640 [Candidatus Eisenbacteria bacterium]
MNPTPRDVQSLFAPTLLALSLVIGAAAAGCGQEGKTVQAVLPVQGLAYDATSATVTSNTLGDTLSVLANLKLKIQTTYANGCEARGGLELRTEGSTTDPLYVITPLSRYTADEPCNIGLAGDTLQVLTVNGVRLNLPRTATVDSIARFEVRGFGAPPIRFEVNVGIASRGDTATGYFVKVEDKDTGAAIDGANVRVERFGTPDVLGEGLTSGGGYYSFNVACTDSVGTADDSYVVKVSWAGRITILTVFGHPSLCRRREQIIVRV